MDSKEFSILSTLINELENFPLNPRNKVKLFSIINETKLKVKTHFGENHILYEKFNKIRFLPASPYPIEMQDVLQNETWIAGIKQLRNVLIEIIDEGRKEIDLNDLSVLEQLLSSGIETDSYEFKSTLRWDLKLLEVNRELEKVILKSICAFNNRHGGNLFIGVSDNGIILGLDNDYATLDNGLGNRDKFELHLRTLLNNNFGLNYTSQNLEISFPKPNEIEICHVKIKKGHNPLLLIDTDKHGQKKEKFYIRSGNQSKEFETVSALLEYVIYRFAK